MLFIRGKHRGSLFHHLLNLKQNSRIFKNILSMTQIMTSILTNKQADKQENKKSL